jgi:hypothetical protein
MIYLLKKSDYTTKDHKDLWHVHTKHYQHIEMRRKASEFDGYGLVTGDIGSKINFDNLANFKKSSSRIVIDPYNNSAGAGSQKFQQFLIHSVYLGVFKGRTLKSFLPKYSILLFQYQ